MMTKEGSPKIVRFLAKESPHNSNSENALFLSESSPLLSGKDQTN